MIHSTGGPKQTPSNVSKTHSEIDDFLKIERFTSAQCDAISRPPRGRKTGGMQAALESIILLILEDTESMDSNGGYAHHALNCDHFLELSPDRNPSIQDVVATSAAHSQETLPPTEIHRSLTSWEPA